jgi:hypothetical protein
LGIPNPEGINVGGSLGSIGPVTVAPVDATIGGSLGSIGPVTIAPTTFDINIDKLPAIHLDVDKLPKIQLGVDPLELTLKLTEVPSQRVHLPADFHVGLSFFGIDVMCLRLCGEAQMINEPYVPNPCEQCGPASERAP